MKRVKKQERMTRAEQHQLKVNADGMLDAKGVSRKITATPRS